LRVDGLDGIYLYLKGLLFEWKCLFWDNTVTGYCRTELALHLTGSQGYLSNDSIRCLRSLTAFCSFISAVFICFCTARCWLWYDMIYLTAVGLPPGGSITVHIYTQTIHRTTQNKQYIEQHNILEECGPCPVLASYTVALAYNWGKSTEKPQSG